MVYIMKFYVDGGCRNNGYSNAIGAAAACLMSRNNSSFRCKAGQLITSYHSATNQRAEILAIILALQWVLEKYETLHSEPYLRVTIHSDSRYAVGCMSKWIDRWIKNGWVNSKGHTVANVDMIQMASDLHDEVEALGQVDYVYVPRSENQNADRKCNEALDRMEKWESDASEHYYCF
ncbi:ribonuclease H-like domain-containing protein [Hypomontagnella monticulosa]|nr:ribonuclease H-like domain-containing protein [Hypomontagnella monticulosa]